MPLILAIVAPPNPSVQLVRYILTTTGILTLIGGIIWTIWIIRTFRRDLQRHRQGRCMSCGYDLRFCKERCSECGAPIREAAGGKS